jgi:diguanylate cyclase (GGDEF)-like protein
MPHPFRLKLPLLCLSAALAGGWLYGLANALVLLVPALLGLAWWGHHLLRELRLWRGMIAAMPYRMAIYAADQRLIWHNARPGTVWSDKIAGLGPCPELRAVLRVVLAHLPEPERGAEFNRRLALHERADGQPFEIRDSHGAWERMRKMRLPGGQVASFSVDISRAKRDEIALAESEGRLRHVLEMAPVGIWKLDETGRTIFANRRLIGLFGDTTPSGLAGSGLLLTSGGDALGPFGFATWGENEAQLQLPGQAPRRLLVTASPWVGGDHGQPSCVLSLLDVTPLKAAQERIEELIERDPLTGLANRATFRAALEAMAADAKGGVLLLVDLDQFKAANDRYGHAMGDALLIEAGRRLREAMRPSDLVSRLGGDEFAVLAFGANATAALPLADRLRHALRRAVILDGVEVPLSGSLGIACAPQHGTEADALLRAADLALFEARSEGRDTAALFQPALRERAEQRAELREAFAEALAAEELELHLQPQQNLESQRLVGAEALIRWNSRRLGRWVSPAELLPAAAEAGLLLQLDRFVLRRSVALLAEWGDRPDAPPHLGINISISTLHDPAFAQEVAHALRQAGVAPERLEIEIPEDLAIRDLPLVARTLAALREIGVPLSLDDFGGGHSGLPHVVRLPVQRLKLDRSITAGLPDDPKAYAVLRATMALARGMGIEVIGEGVETEGQAFALRRAGCHIIQGWLIARPMPAHELVPPLLPEKRRALA